MSADGRQPGLLEGLPPRPAAGIYFDNNATTPVAPEVVAKMVPLLTEHYGNPSSMHSFGARAGDEVAVARQKVATFLGAAQPSEIVFTSGGSEGDNLGIVGTLYALPEKRHLVTTEVEHPAVLGLCRELQKRHGYDVTFLKVDGAGRLDPGDVEAVEIALHAPRRVHAPDSGEVGVHAATGRPRQDPLPRQDHHAERRAM